MDNKATSPIFIHSLFRAGSTYLFNAFRRSAAGYWCYQEPLNERLIDKAKIPNGLQVGIKGASKVLRHPELDKPHSHEFHVASDKLLDLFHKPLSYDQYFISSANNTGELKDYFSALINAAQGRSVLQCCRTTGRVSTLKSGFPGLHIFLERNPWDQWWSYKQSYYFDARNLLIINADSLPKFLQQLKQELNIPSFKNNPATKEAYCNNRRLDSRASYKIFYALWCHSILEAKSLCHLSINIDQLSNCSDYQKETSENLKAAGADNIDFSDCSIPKATYGESDGLFFSEVENQIHELLRLNGYSAEEISKLETLSKDRLKSIVDTSLAENSTVRDAMRAREYLQRAETQLSETQAALFSARTKIQQMNIQ
jgi:hypothetical protein